MAETEEQMRPKNRNKPHRSDIESLEALEKWEDETKKHHATRCAHQTRGIRLFSHL